MVCCGACSEDIPDKRGYDPSYQGPTKQRRCTDVVCLILLIAFLAGWGFISVYAFLFGNVSQLIYPSNSAGEVCGRGGNAGRPLLLFFDLTRCARLSALAGCSTPQVCVDTCPSRYWTYSLGKIPELESYCTGLDSGEFASKGVEQLVRERKCPAYLTPTRNVLGRCVPSFDSSGNVTEANSSVSMLRTMNGTAVSYGSLEEGLNYLMSVLDVGGIGSKLVQDLSQYWWILLLSFLLALILSLLWIGVMRYAAGPLVWLSILLSILLILGITAFSWFRFYQLMTSSGQAADDILQAPSLGTFKTVYNNRTVWLILAIVLTVASIVLLIVFLFLRSRINLAIELIEESSKAVSASIQVLAFPVLPFLCQVGVFVWFCLVASYLASAGRQVFQVVEPCSACLDPVTGAAYRANQVCDPTLFPSCPSCPNMKCVFSRFGPGSQENWFQVYNIFGLLWLVFFLEAYGEMVMAGVFAGWYWTFDKANDLPSSPVWSSLYRTSRYHLGSLAFGSLVLSILRFIRLLIEATEEKLKQYGQDHAVARVLLCLCKCFFLCMENCLKFLSRNAYIMTAIYGESFCRAAAHSFGLISRNLVRVVVLDKVTDFILFIGKMIVAGMATALAVLLLSTVTASWGTQLHYQPVPIVLAFFGAFSIASCFSSVYAMAVDTIFLCMLEDLERHDGTPNDPYFMDPDLQKIVAKET